ncbi:MAG: class I SAM-dependent methyltransferase, partial [Elusimicrobiota bacterium]|nr:class I SAM-dependent methyltransferase [Elusimicrobiota bacterium]
AARYEDISVEGLKRWVGYYRVHYLELLSLDKNAGILDIGCGYGRMLYFLKSEGFKNFYGIDVSREQIDTAIKNGFSQVECSSAFDFLENKKKQFDTVIMMDVLEHIEKPEVLKLLDKTYSALKKGGSLILQLPNGLTPFNVFLYQDFTHETAYTSASISQLLSASGFENIKVFPIVPHIHGPKSLILNLMWRIVWQNLIRFYMLTANGNLMGDIYTSNLIAFGQKK